MRQATDYYRLPGALLFDPRQGFQFIKRIAFPMPKGDSVAFTS